MSGQEDADDRKSGETSQHRHEYNSATWKTPAPATRLGFDPTSAVRERKIPCTGTPYTVKMQHGPVWSMGADGRPWSDPSEFLIERAHIEGGVNLVRRRHSALNAR